MNPKEKRLVDDLCGKNGGFYTEDFYEIEVVDETAVKKASELYFKCTSIPSIR